MQYAANISATGTPEMQQAVSQQLYVVIQQCIGGERAAQRQLYDQFAPVLYGIVRRYCDDQHNAEEILNDAFYKIFTNLKQYSFQGSFEGWMRRITVNMITDHFRKYTKKEPQHKAEIQDGHAQVGEDAVSNMNYKELLATVHSLPTTQRTVFNLFVFEQLSHKEIADMLEITETNSRWHLNDARRRLKEKITSQM